MRGERREEKSPLCCFGFASSVGSSEVAVETSRVEQRPEAAERSSRVSQIYQNEAAE